ncbi:MAG TPA: OBAP family protein, partial [Luteitalea sp.]|nr:OBAP family protein [Luteitalea sp.]
GPQGGDDATAGRRRSARTAALEAGADVAQRKGPVTAMSMHLVGFHPAKADAAMQMESHHFCNQVNEDLAQCVLFDGDTPEARLHGVEYIISARLYDTLPSEERAYWHPHNYEILSGTLRLPGLPDVAEDAALRDKMNSYGKTWHVWQSGVFGRAPDPLPLGPPHLAWSFNRDGEATPEMVASRDRRMTLDTAAARERRRALIHTARPQGGVDAMRGQFADASEAPEGVRDSGSAGTRPVPHTVWTPAPSTPAARPPH